MCNNSSIHTERNNNQPTTNYTSMEDLGLYSQSRWIQIQANNLLPRIIFAKSAAMTFFFFQSTVCLQYFPGLSSGVNHTLIPTLCDPDISFFSSLLLTLQHEYYIQAQVAGLKHLLHFDKSFTCFFYTDLDFRAIISGTCDVCTHIGYNHLFDFSVLSVKPKCRLAVTTLFSSSCRSRIFSARWTVSSA